MVFIVFSQKYLFQNSTENKERNVSENDNIDIS